MVPIPSRRTVAIVAVAVLGLCAAVLFLPPRLDLEPGAPGVVEAQEERAPRRVRLSARHPDGVPVHAGVGDHGFVTRLPDGAEVEILEVAEGGRWLRVRGGGTTGWIVSRYLARDGHPSPRPTPSLDPASPWASAAACEAALARGERAPGAGSDLRLGSWNVRWFPDGRAGSPRSGGGTDVPWLACAIAWLDLDALAVQEWVTHLRGRRATLDLLAELRRRTGHRWEHALDDCPDDGRQHVGLFWDTERVEATDLRTLPGINPGRSACHNRLRPGFAAILRTPAGREVQVVVVHLDSGVQARDRANRRASVRRLARLGEVLPSGGPARGLVVLGDFNTMGCSRCPEGLDGPGEVTSVLDALVAGTPPLRPPSSSPACSTFHRGRGSLLDHVFVGGALDPAEVRLEVHGTCAEYRCGHVDGQAEPFTERLSDHCPLVVEVPGLEGSSPPVSDPPTAPPAPPAP